ncbi:hypothetical protein ACNKHQ_15660 [Shigella flexneri]
MAIDENKQKASAAALVKIEKQFGKDSIMRLEKTAHGCRSHLYRFAFTGRGAGAGGLLVGRIVEIDGSESSGKRP